MYCSTSQVKEALQTSSVDQDALIGALCARVTALIAGYTGRSFLPVTETLQLDGDGSSLLVLPRSPVRAIDSLTMDGALVSPDTYVWYDDGRVRMLGSGRYSARLRTEQGVFTCGYQNVVVAGSFGYVEVPGDVEQAAIMQVVRWLKAKDNAFADATGSPDAGQLIYSKQLYPEIKGILDHYRARVGRLAVI